MHQMALKETPQLFKEAFGILKPTALNSNRLEAFQSFLCLRLLEAPHQAFLMSFPRLSETPTILIIFFLSP